MRTRFTYHLKGRNFTDVKLSTLKKLTILLLNVCVFTGLLYVMVPAADAANTRTLCNYVEFDHPKTNYGLRVTVEKEYGKVTGDFLVGFYADGHVFASEWMSSNYVSTWGGFYIASKMFYYGAGTRYRVDLYLHDGFDLAYLKVQKEYLIYLWGYPFWISIGNEGPLIEKWVSLHLLGCNYY